MDDLNSQELFQIYCEGSSQAATELFDRYVQRLISLARGKISTKLRRRIDAEDVVQSAYRSFFLHAANEEYSLVHAGDLWRLLTSITLNKLYGQIEKQTAERRNVDREEPIAQSQEFLPRSPEPTPAEVIAILEQLELVSRRLEPDERAVLIAYLQGQTIDEICKLIEKSPRTVRRLLARARQQIEQEFIDNSRIISRPYKRDIGTVTEPRAPLLYDHYVLNQLIGSGGMGKVYRATQKSSEKTVALKTLHKTRLSDERATEQFLQEAQILSTLRHPNIVGVEGLGRFPGGGYFLVMDFIGGGDFQSRLSAGRLEVLEALRIVHAVATAIAHAHEQGIVHCDLKPANILMDEDGKPVVSDFGFAQIVSNLKPNARSVGGTIGYIAPEVRRGELPASAADIYALGALLWALLTGSPPSGPSSIVAQSYYDTDLVEICSKCVADDPAKRYSTAYEFVQTLDQFVSNSCR